MADTYIKISELEETTLADDASYIPIDNGNHTYKITVENYNSGANATAQSYAEAAAASADDAEAAKTAAEAAETETGLIRTATQQYATAAAGSAANAAASAIEASTYAEGAAASEANAEAAAQDAADYATLASDKATLAQSWAVGDTHTRTGEDTNNASYYANQAQGAYENALEQADAAGDSADAAASSASDAADSATAAAGSASDASDYATAASGSATAAATSATQSANSAGAAATSATNAAASATAASGSASTATTQANNAAQSATTAGGYATQAASSASDASGYATNAANSATAAAGSATAAAASASDAADSAADAAESAATFTTDDTLSIAGKAADAKAAGDMIAAVQAEIPELDNWLTTPGAAAEAKHTGDRLTEVEDDVTNLLSALTLINTEHIVLESGTFKEANGTEKVANASRARSVTPISADNFVSLVLPSGYQAWCYLLDEHLALIGTAGSWYPVLTKDRLRNARYINLSIRNKATPSSPITDEIATIESGIEFITLNEFDHESLANLGTKIRDSICYKRSPDFTSTGRALHSDGTSSMLTGYNLYKYAVSPGELVWIVASVDNPAIWQGVWQWQDSEPTPALNPTVVGWTRQSGIDAVVEVPDGVSYLVVCGAATNDATGVYAFLDSVDASTAIVKKYINAGTLMDRKSVQKNADACFVFFSDIHAGATNYGRIIDFCDGIGAESVDAIINGGDTVQSLLDESVAWYDQINAETSFDVLTCVGNHDVWETLWQTGDPVTIYNKFTAPVVSRVSDIIQPSGAAANGLNYYYKDYSDVRVIVLAAMYYTAQDQLLWTAAQKTWLDGVLADAITNGKSVVCVNHAPYMKSKADIDASLPLNSWRNYTNNSIFDGICLAQEAVDAVHAYIANGGKFVCWLTGHTHQDMVMTEKDYADQFLISIASAKYIYHTDGFSPEANDLSATSYDCFDYIGIDTTNSILKVWRIGFNEDASMRIRNRFAYDYANRKILAYS